MRANFMTGASGQKVAALCLILLLAVLGATGYWMLFSNFALYDDEGYILVAAREYYFHGHLYDVVYSQYGPAFHVLMDGFQRLMQTPLDHTSARWLTLGFWLGGAMCCGALVWRQSGSRYLGLFTQAATFLYLYFIRDEPFHPGGSIIFILSLSLLFLTEFIRAGHWTRAAALAGGAGAILVLTKINVGAFFLVAIAAWGALNATSPLVRRLARPVVAAALIAFAVVLMHTLRGETWIQIYLALFAVGAVTLVFAVRDTAAIGGRLALIFAVAAGVVAIGVLTLVWWRGTSPAGLLEGVLLGPLHHPGNYSYPVDWRPGTILVAVLSAILALVHFGLRRKSADAAADRLIVVARLLQTAVLLVALAGLMQLRVIGAVFSYTAPLIWTWVVPLKNSTRAMATTARGLVAMVLLLQYLHGYPIGGSQESWATFLFLPLVALGLGELKEWFDARAPAGVPALFRGSRLAAVLLIVIFSKAGWIAFRTHQTYAARPSLGLPGAEALHLPESLRTAYRVVSANAVVHADLLFSQPGMYSFNLWTGLPTPTEKNTTLWFTLLGDADQGAIVRAIARAERPCIIAQESLAQVMRAGNVPIRGPLCDYLRDNFSPAFRTEGFVFLVRNGRTLSPLNIATLGQRATSDVEPDTQLDFCFPSDGTPIAAFDVKDLFSSTTPTLSLDATNTATTLNLTDRNGRSLAAPTPATWPLRYKGLARISVRFHRREVALSAVTTVVYAKGANGEILGEIRIAE